jgi:hypothetical protein
MSLVCGPSQQPTSSPSRSILPDTGQIIPRQVDSFIPQNSYTVSQLSRCYFAPDRTDARSTFHNLLRAPDKVWDLMDPITHLSSYKIIQKTGTHLDERGGCRESERSQHRKQLPALLVDVGTFCRRHKRHDIRYLHTTALFMRTRLALLSSTSM